MNPTGCAMTSTSKVPGQCDAAACNYPFCEASGKPGPIKIETPTDDALRARMVREALERVARHVCVDRGVGEWLLLVAQFADDESLSALGRMLK